MAQFDLSIKLEYDLVLESHQIQLVEGVRKRIADGWKPLGGISTWEGYLCQAMIREFLEEEIPAELYHRGMRVS